MQTCKFQQEFIELINEVHWNKRCIHHILIAYCNTMNSLYNVSVTLGDVKSTIIYYLHHKCLHHFYKSVIVFVTIKLFKKVVRNKNALITAITIFIDSTKNFLRELRYA